MSQNNFNDVKKTKKKVNFLIISLMVLLIGGGLIYGGYTYLENQRIEREIAEKLAEEQARILEEEKLEKARVDKALEQPYLYWDLTYTSANDNGTYSAYYAYDEANNVAYFDQMCVIVGVSPVKNVDSEYFIEDTIDGGKFKFNLNEFYINGYTPIKNKGNCAWRINDSKIQYNSEFELSSGESALLLFKIKVSDLKQTSSDFTYKYITITTLNTSKIE